MLESAETALPTMSTTTFGVGAAGSALPGVSSGSLVKLIASSIVGLLGMYYLAQGKKNNDVEKMVIGAVLTLGSMFFF